MTAKIARISGKMTEFDMKLGEGGGENGRFYLKLMNRRFKTEKESSKVPNNDNLYIDYNNILEAFISPKNSEKWGCTAPLQENLCKGRCGELYFCAENTLEIFRVRENS